MSQSTPVVRAESAAAPARHTAGPRVAELDGLRGIAILLVLVFHYAPKTGPLRYLGDVFGLGWTGVDLFFVLSGFLITGILLDSVGRPHYYRNFIVRRSLRIFPLYYACLVLYCVLSFVPDPIRWKDFLGVGDGWWYVGYLGNIQVFLKNAWPGAAILTPLWSLQVEEQFYLTFPLLVWATKRTTLARILVASVIGALVIRIALVVAAPKNLMGTYALMPCRMDALAMGGLVAIAARERPEWLKARWIGWATAVSAATFLLICGFVNSSPWSSLMRTVGYTAIDLAFTGVLVMLLCWRQRQLLGLCRVRFLMWVGTISYGLYLLHMPAANISHRWIAPLLGIGQSSSTEFFVMMALAMAMAWISWTIFESPILRLKELFTIR
ncbi:MAG TPA: acyltransferase [Bryobacteraceae bacterium]|nr:acyltransferase [Bryobacteraceae bacterium]